MNSPVAAIKKHQQAKLEKQKELKITFGEQDAIDVLSYA